jgi:hypothetical protein
MIQKGFITSVIKGLVKNSLGGFPSEYLALNMPHHGLRGFKVGLLAPTLKIGERRF